MKLRTQREDGSIETINLIEPVSMRYNEGSPLWMLINGNGTEHFFTTEGFYDGWGRDVPELSAGEASDYAGAVEDARVVESSVTVPALPVDESNEPVM